MSADDRDVLIRMEAAATQLRAARSFLAGDIIDLLDDVAGEIKVLRAVAEETLAMDESSVGFSVQVRRAVAAARIALQRFEEPER